MTRKSWLLIGGAALVILWSSSLGVTQVTTFTLTVTKLGSGSGTVTSSPAGINCGATCSATFASGTSVTLTAVAASGSAFTGWNGACSGTGVCVVTMDANKSVTATFVTTLTLTVTKAGGGSGTVTSSPAGINCGTSCSATFTSGTTVTLTATPERGSIFDRWGGACSGTSSTCSITMDANKSVTATFLPTRTIGYTGDVEGTDRDDIFQRGGETVVGVTIRGDGNGNFADGPTACPVTGCGNDRIVGTIGDDLIFGDDGRGGVINTGHDWIMGDGGNDTIYGEAGNDILIGGDGNDFIDGGPGNDVIDGRYGVDTIFGGGGNDTFIIRAGNPDAGTGTTTIICTQSSGELGRVLVRGNFKARIPFGTYRSRETTVVLEDRSVRFSDPMIYEIMTGPGKCVIRRG